MGIHPDSPRHNPNDGVHLPPCKGRKHFFLKKEAKTLARLSPTSPRSVAKVFWFFFQKRTASLLSLRRLPPNPRAGPHHIHIQMRPRIGRVAAAGAVIHALTDRGRAERRKRQVVIEIRRRVGAANLFAVTLYQRRLIGNTGLLQIQAAEAAEGGAVVRQVIEAAEIGQIR